MHLTQFLITSAVLIVVPGVDFALVTRQAIGAGRRAAISTAAGLVVGGLTHATLATVGLSALLLASARLYVTVNWPERRTWSGSACRRCAMRGENPRLTPPVRTSRRPGTPVGGGHSRPAWRPTFST
jgi:hypothetical protein